MKNLKKSAILKVEVTSQSLIFVYAHRKNKEKKLWKSAILSLVDVRKKF